MIANLSEIEIDKLLKNEVVGRIGCSWDGKVYIVPISYAFEGNSIYAHTFEGLKVDAMRKNPEVCFEVDDIKNMGNWQSVIAWGTYEEIVDKEECKAALQLLLNRHLPVISSITTHLGKNWPFTSNDLDNIEGIIFRIKLSNRTGKYETSMESPFVHG